MSAQVMSVSAVFGMPTMRMPYHEELSASHENRSLFEMLARQREKVLEADRDWQDIKAQLASACRQQDNILQANAVAAAVAEAIGEIAPDMDATEDQFSFSSWEFDEDADEDILPTDEATSQLYPLSL